MMYNNKLVVAVKANNKILREFKDVVRVPFGTEYSILLKNLHNKRAKVFVEIDGQDVLGGRSMVIRPNSEVELTRFVNDLTSGNTFKFIERTEGIEEHRGIKLDDGIIRITFKYEAQQKTISSPPIWTINNQNNHYYGSSGISSDHLLRNSLLSNTVRCAAHPSDGQLMNMAINSYSLGMTGNVGNSGPEGVVYSATVSDVGITVPGSISNQQFTEVLDFTTELEEHVMILRLSGIVEGVQVTQPITVKTKPKCITCGTVAKTFDAKFCASCGTSLTII